MGFGKFCLWIFGLRNCCHLFSGEVFWEGSKGWGFRGIGEDVEAFILLPHGGNISQEVVGQRDCLECELGIKDEVEYLKAFDLDQRQWPGKDDSITFCVLLAIGACCSTLSGVVTGATLRNLLLNVPTSLTMIIEDNEWVEAGDSI